MNERGTKLALFIQSHETFVVDLDGMLLRSDMQHRSF